MMFLIRKKIYFEHLKSCHRVPGTVWPGDYDGDVSETKLTERQQKILNLIKESPTITGKQMSETLSVSQRTIERDLSALQKKGILKHEGKDNDGAWVIVKNNVNWY